MKHLRFALFAAVSTLGLAHAQDEERRAPPVEIPDFSNLDEYIYEPKSTVRFGFRYISGAKTSFSGQGRILSPENPGERTGANLQRVYHDGSVQPDSRTVARLDSSGNPIIDPQSNSAVFDAIAPDGRTNSWNYTDASQLSQLGFVAFHTYSAEIIDTDVRRKETASSAGMDITVARDMGKLWGRLPWTLTTGLSINDISANTTDRVRATLTTLTDFYNLYGRVPPDAPYSSPSSATTTVVDASGNPVLNDDGSTKTSTTDTSVLIGNEPAGRTIDSITGNSNVDNRWKVKGAYYTMRAGPTVWVPITTRLRASLSVGAAIVYSGTNYTVTQTFAPELGAEISDTASSAAYKLLPGYYADATVQFDLTERAGFYAGAVFQSAGSYTQTVNTDTANYSTKIDLANQNGVRAGLSIRF
ncbi:hypothetical protein [Horticoccus sp. 23ND18S-11]|uniref:hypothetical protein n=1 Tax=Horticoccus sp. 23ND18S-11 TaxID=3391832 RepID=UPI0039C9C4FB